MFDADAAILIGMAKGTSKNIKIDVGELSFREFSKFCCKPQKGGKHESYFVRGVPNIEDNYISKSGREYGKGRYRHDSAIPSADFLVIDADNSKCSPRDVHSALNKLDYIHFIYTSHSHSAKVNNFRVVLPCQISSKDYMVPTAKKIIKDLQDEGVDIQYVKEMGTWSQAWYLPTRDDPDDGIFEHYASMDGTEYLQVEKAEAAESEFDAEKLKEDVQNMAEIIGIITSGGAGLHNAMLSYSYGAVRDGQAKSVVKETLKGLMQACPNKDKRWQERFDDIDRIVDGADEDEKINIYVPQELKVINEVDWPPDMMGELANAVCNYSVYPNKIVGIVTALGLIAGISGRCFNINGAGLNIYATLLANTGGGKSFIGDFIGKTLNEASIFANATIYTGGRKYTGPKPLINDLYKRRCFVSVFTESGFMFKSKAGDQAGLKRIILDLYGLSGFGQYLQPEQYSNEKDSTKQVASPCFSMVNESTPDVFLQALRGGTETGELTRMNIFRVSVDRSKANRNKKYELSDKLMGKIKKLMSHCATTQSDDIPDVTNFVVDERMWEFFDKCGRDADHYEEDDPIRSRMLSRAGLKTWKIACLCTVLNQQGAKGTREMLVGDAEWDWAVKLHEYEMAGLEDFFVETGGDSIYEVVMDKVYPKIAKCLNRGYQESQLRPSREDINENRIPLVMLRRLLRKVKDVRSLGTDWQDGFDVLIKYMTEKKFIRVKGNSVKVLQLFVDNYKEWR